MRKLSCLLLALTLLLSLSGTVWADPSAEKDSKSADVYAKYQSVAPDTVYSVDITWGEMQFTYKEIHTKVWNPADRDYINNITSAWEASGNTVTVTNHSNAAVIADFAFASLDAHNTVTGTFDVSSQELDAGTENGYDSADKVTSTLSLSGTLANTVTTATKVGTITVTVS